MARPVTVGPGTRMTVYVPRALHERMQQHKTQTLYDGIKVRHDNSSFVQEAIRYYCDRLDDLAEYDAAMTREAERRLIINAKKI